MKLNVEPKQAAEQVLLFGQAADPQIDLIEAGDRAGAPCGASARGVMDRAGVVDVVGVGAEAVQEVEGVLAEGGAAESRCCQPAPARAARLPARRGRRR